jgi:hypothetical protein
MAFSDWCCDLPKHFVSVCRPRTSPFPPIHASERGHVCVPGLLIRGAESPGQKGKSMKTSGQINPEGSEYFCVRHAG